MIKLDMLSQIPSSCLCTQLGVLAKVPRLNKLFSVAYEDFLYMEKFLPLSGKILDHDSVPVVVSGFTSLIMHLVICRYQGQQTFLHVVELRQCVFYNRLLYFWF